MTLFNLIDSTKYDAGLSSAYASENVILGTFNIPSLKWMNYAPSPVLNIAEYNPE